ncbi:hypothetical protein ABC502_02990 [Alkalimonas sp. NCh-2]|uniref:hypothetical protein n=1 Tax=Alkalimonas sp. NCh-2 TaxID=3144846 RepID=UPI0031F7173A
MKLFIFSVFLCFASVDAFARVNCPAATVSMIQVESNFVLYQQHGGPWRRLGVLDDVGTKERLSVLLAAQMSGKKVFVSYKNTQYDCSVTNTTESAYIVRIYAD